MDQSISLVNHYMQKEQRQV